MSLINEALKKAQKQRENVPGAPPPPARPPVASAAGPGDPPPRRNAATSTNAVLIAGAFAIIAVSVAATVYFLREPGKSQLVAVETRPPATSSSVSPGLVAIPSVSIPSTPLRVAVASTVANNPSSPAPLRAGPAVSPPGGVGSAPSGNVPIAPGSLANQPSESHAVAVEPIPIKATLRIQAMIDKFRVAGIRISDTDSRVILNDHLFRMNELVESSIGLRLTKIDAHLLSFSDAEGNTYQKRF